MTTFSYAARSKTGEKMSGTIDADNKADAIRKLERMNLIPVSINPGTDLVPIARSASTGLNTCGAAITSLVLGILSLLLFFMRFFIAVPAVIFGHVAMSRIKNNPKEITGTGIARAGLVLGYLSIAVWVFSIARPAFDSGRERAIQAHSPATTAPATPRHRTTTQRPSQGLSDVVGQAWRESTAKVNTQTDTPQPQSQFPNVLSVIQVLFQGQGLVDSGRYSRDQQEQIFTDRFKGRQYFVYGEISDVGTTAFGGRKYITIQVTAGHYFNIFPADDFNLLDYSKGQRIGFVGEWTSLGTGIMVKHDIKNAVAPSAARYGSAPAQQQRREPEIPYDQQTFAGQLRAFKTSYREVLKLGNDLREKEVIDAAKAFLEENRQIQNWVGTVQGVADSLGSSWVKVTADGVEYNLWPPEKGLFAGNDPLPIFRELTKGQHIRFSGQMTGSMRLTASGGINDPRMKITPTSIEVIE